MQQVNSTDFKNHLSEFLDRAKEEPVVVNKLGRAIAVVLSSEEYEHLQRLDDLYWVARAEAAEANGQWASHDEAMQALMVRLKQPE